MGVYIWKERQREPGDKTVVYYKFNGDIKDYSGNGYDLTGSPTINNGYITLSGNRLYNSSSSISWDSSSNYTVVAWLRNFNTSYSNSLYRCQAGVLSAYASDLSGSFPLTYLGIANGVASTPVGTVMGTNALGTAYADGSGNNTTIMVDGNTRTCVIVTLDRANNVTYFHKNGNTSYVFAKTGAGTSSDSPITGIQVGIVGGTSYGGNARYYFGDIGEIILEKKKWTTDEISSYYNNKKSLYGIT